MSKNRTRAGWILAGLLSALFLSAAAGKFFMADAGTNFAGYGLADWRYIIGLGEMASALLFLIPRTSIAGTLLLSAHMGGAIVVHMSHGEPFVFQSVLLVLVWITGMVRNPELRPFK